MLVVGGGCWEKNKTEGVGEKSKKKGKGEREKEKNGFLKTLFLSTVFPTNWKINSVYRSLKTADKFSLRREQWMNFCYPDPKH